MPVIDVRRIESKDLLRVLGFYEELFRDLLPALKTTDLEIKLKEEKIRLEKTVNDGRGFVALCSGVQGYLVYGYYDNALNIEQLYVHNLFRGLGLGGLLVTETAKDALQDNFSLALKLPQRTHNDYQKARKFYEKLGFVFTRGNGYSLDQMEMTLENARKLVHNSKQPEKRYECRREDDLVHFTSPSRIAISGCSLCKDSR